jgi:hypothetical protein
MQNQKGRDNFGDRRTIEERSSWKSGLGSLAYSTAKYKAFVVTRIQLQLPLSAEKFLTSWATSHYKFCTMDQLFNQESA